MNAVEDKLRDALGSHAEQTAVDTTRLWHATNRRIRARRAARSARMRWLVPVVGVGALTAAAAIGVPALLDDPEPRVVTPAVGDVTPEPSPSSSATPTPSATPRPSVAPSWRWVFHDPTPHQLDLAVMASGAGDIHAQPVDFVRTADGDVVLYAFEEPVRDPAATTQRYFGPCVLSYNFKTEATSGECAPPETWFPPDAFEFVSSGRRYDYVEQAGIGPLSYVTGLTIRSAGGVVGVDSEGRRHEAKLVSSDFWSVQQYVLVVPKSTRLETIEVYDKGGNQLGSVPAEE